ncbi:translesion error-prone DNA polymerase V autoproteolytic subunit [Stenotrophomonas sp. PA-6-5C]|uniref:LexA family protein n=1 Tax=Stenotrophomonas sp. PA-6-5C TaxID=2665487 RepID=UPI001F1C845A|nr:translesion error-prone DNA polymerase V autoproteolytic subunit [Stenotrophomonas sp. PA-6-5C]MCF5092984.1 translesion error-prone DNA polymerase V autoproteolytic subunit [Stenotrophomonas sp. PA-6-5C]
MQSLPYPHTLALPIGQAMIDSPAQFVPLASARARLGFPSPADDFMDEAIDLHRLLVRNPAATFLYRADGWSMSGAGVSDGDILVVDRSVTPQAGDLVIAIWDGNQPTCKVLQLFESHMELHSANPDFPPIVLEQPTEVEVFAVVGVVRQIKRRGGHVRAR